MVRYIKLNDQNNVEEAPSRKIKGDKLIIRIQ